MRRSMSRSRYRRKKASALTDISLTPLVDTALTLLVIFMITTPMIQNAVRVNLPRGQAKEDSNQKQELVVYIDKDAQLFFNGNKFAQNDLIDVIKAQVGEQKDKMVFVKADRAVAYGCVLELVDVLKVIGGVSYVALATQKRA